MSPATSFAPGFSQPVTGSGCRRVITLSCGYPVYIPSSLFSDLDSEIQIMPILGGYRSERQRSLVITTPFETVLNELNEIGIENLALEQFLIAVPTREIAHAHLYDIALGEIFRARGTAGGAVTEDFGDRS